MKTPVVLIVFNRPKTTELVFAEIANARPPKLLIVADGPRPDRPGEAALCEAARSVVKRIDWDCEVLINFADENMGCQRRVSSGVDWAFANVEEAIFLEDDCLPHRSFFRFCDEMLERYRDDERIMAVSGDNFQFGRKRWPYSYYFSRYIHVWGWASWRRAWKHYDVNMSQWPMIRNGGWLKDFLDDAHEIDFWTFIFDQTQQGKIGTWDYQWVFASWLQSGLCILPNINLVSNIGFGSDSSHTSGKSKLAEIPTEEMRFPLSHPPIVIRDSQADRHTASLFFRRSLRSKARTLMTRGSERSE
jgi:hypothetical protein